MAGRTRLLVLLVLVLAAGVLPAPVRADLKAGREALQRGDWAAAEKKLKTATAADGPEAALALAETYLLTGRHSEALAAAKLAAGTPAQKSEALRLQGESYLRTGKLAEARTALAGALQANPKNTHARADLGRLYHNTGQKALMEQTLQVFLDDFAHGSFEKAGAPELTDLAIAAHTLEMWQDANEQFRLASEKDPAYLRASLEWGDLFQEKYRPGEAQKSYEAVLKINPNHPLALLGMARLQLIGKYDVRGATQYADRALAQNPHLVEAMDVKAGLFLDNEEYGPAEALLHQALAINPNHLEAQTLLAASRYLQDDRAGFEAIRASVLKIHPHYGDFFAGVSEYVVKQHRYQDAIDLNQQAISLAPDNERALVALGTGYLRMGMATEEKGLAQLRKAWHRDPFNVMNYNLLTLFEEVIPKNYETVSSGNFRFRFNKKEKPVLATYVPALVQQCWDALCKKYGFTPKNPITVELFTERQHYAVRTTGLPDLDAQGTCFGQLVTAMSPSCGEANWQEVLWHELSHVFAIQLSNNRVPRWFTEGLSEYETNVVRPEWKREHNRELFLSLKRGDLWSIPELNAAFTRPNRPNGVVIAYHQSSLVIHFLVETCGFPKIVEALKLYGQGKRDAEVLPAISGKKLPELDQGFRAWLAKRLAAYDGRFMVDWQLYADTDRLKAEAAAKPADAPAQAAYAAALFVDKAFPEAKQEAEKALGLDGKNLLARFILAQVAMEAKDLKAAKAEYDALLAAGADSYGIRLALGQIAAREDDVEGAMRHLNAAKALDPDRGEPYQLLAELYRAKNRDAEAIKELQAFTRIEEHDHDPARQLFERMVAARDSAGLLDLAPRLIAIQPMESDVHEQYGRALVAANRAREAVREFEVALATGPRYPATVHIGLARAYLALGDKPAAKAAATAALKDEPGNEEATALLKELG
jgi:tetratricopeptide (TPR) repeat protein